MKIGYARVSTSDQHLRMQEDTLKNAGCTEIFTDIISGTKADRLGRSIQHLIQTVKSLQERKIGLQSLQEVLILRPAAVN